MKRRLALAAGYGLFFLGPLVWQALTSFWPEDQLTRAMPSALTLANYAAVFREHHFLRTALNSFLVASLTTAAALAIGAPAAFALAKLPVPGRRAVLSFSLAVSMFPPIATVSPLYLFLRAIGLRDTLVGLAVPYTTFALPLALWILTSFFAQLPGELLAAARVDGCTPLQAFRRVFLPLAAPGIGTTAILIFLFAWNELLYALTFVTTPAKRTVPVALSLFASDFREPWGQLAAASLVATVPLVIVTVVFQRRIVSGLTAGAVKG